MHFWIDKRSQTCGFSGRRRIPASISASYGQQRRRRRRSRGKLMVTPVHRFQPIESVAGSQHGSRRSHHHHQLQHHYYPAPYVPPASPRHSRGHSAELDSSVYLDVPLDSRDEGTPVHVHVGNIKRGMWVSLGLATLIVAGAKVYFDYQGSVMQVVVFCTLMLISFVVAVVVALYHSNVMSEVSVAAAETQAPTSSTSHELEVVITSLTPTVPQPPPPPPPTELPPPPYHIAILLPLQPPPETDDAPPPSYDKVVS